MPLRDLIALFAGLFLFITPMLASADTPCGGEGQRACCVGEASFGACKSGLSEKSGCSGSCRCGKGSPFSSSGTCVEKSSSGTGLFGIPGLGVPQAPSPQIPTPQIPQIPSPQIPPLPTPDACGKENQKPCPVWNFRKSCNDGLVEDFGANKCVKKNNLTCGKNNQRPCTVVERIPSCDAGLVEDFINKKCLPPNQSSLMEVEKFGKKLLGDNSACVKTVVDHAQGLMAPGKRDYFTKGQFKRDYDAANLTNIATNVDIAGLKAKLEKHQCPTTPKTITVGIVADGGLVIGGSVEMGAAFNLSGNSDPVVDLYRTFGINAGLITGVSDSIVVSFLKNPPRLSVGETLGFALSGGEVVNGGTGISFSPMQATRTSPPEVAFDLPHFQGLSFSVGVGASVVPVDVRGTKTLTQIADMRTKTWVADACGGEYQRPCHVVERVPSCGKGLVEDFLRHQCMK